MRLLALGLWVGAVLLATAGTAQAEDWKWRRGQAPSLLNEEDGGLGGELTFFADDRTIAFAPLLGGWIIAADSWVVSVDWGLLFVDPEGNDATTMTGNPLFSFLYAVDMDGLRTEIGLAFAPPLAKADELQEGVDHELVAGIRGLTDPWLWLADALSFLLPIHTETLDEHVHFALDAAFAILLPTEGGDPEPLVQFAIEGGYRDGWGGAGVRLQGVWLANADFLQSSLEPFVRVNVGRQGFLHARATLNLDTPLGFGGEKLWGAHLGGGTSWGSGRTMQ